MAHKPDAAHHLSDIPTEMMSLEETKQYLTPFAFKINKSLFGLPLASPLKRGIALFIDLALIALLSDISGVFLALAIAITFYYLGNNNRAQQQGQIKGRKRRAVLRFIGALMVFVVLLDTLPTVYRYFGVQETESTSQISANKPVFNNFISLATSLAIQQNISESDCMAYSCWQKLLEESALEIANIHYEGDIDLPKADLDELFTDILSDVALTSQEKLLITHIMHEAYQNQIKQFSVDEPNALVTDESKVNISKNTVLVLDNDGQLTDLNDNQDKKKNKPVYSLIEWIKGIIKDLGLGFGWATFYFTAFIALADGQTIGKKLLGIKVLQLDGTPLSLWDSFGRYGGYGAGLATGLLGFIQIFWDANKQAIHDKISATVVIDLKKARLEGNALKSNIYMDK